jgi:hypothetical protein
MQRVELQTASYKIVAENIDAVSQLKTFHILMFINACLIFAGHCLTHCREIVHNPECEIR